MKCLVLGGSGLLGKALCAELGPHLQYAPTRAEKPLETADEFLSYDVAFLCAGTKGFAENEGNREAFRSDVDGNIRIARHLLKQGTFVVFVSTDAVEWALHTAYARNRYMVEVAIGSLPNVGIFRPAKFYSSNVAEVARACAEVGLNRKEGLTRWP